MADLIEYNQEVKEAIKNDAPIVALESTIISHGMPWPENLSTATIVENLLRERGVTPATIALHAGKIRIGLDEELMTELSQNPDVEKASRRDIAYFLSRSITASTTVASTMFCAHQAGLSIFATGGIGGVHPGVNEHFDISADLKELATTPVAVICAGAKSILDLPKTLEVLETNGVPVIGYQTDEFPAFYSRTSGLALVHRLDSPEEIAELIKVQQQLKLKNGLIIANPIPQSAEIPDADIAPIIQQAYLEAENITGKAITPYLLKKLGELTAGKTLNANIELIKNNAILAAEIAIAKKNQKKMKKNTRNP